MKRILFSICIMALSACHPIEQDAPIDNDPGTVYSESFEKIPNSIATLDDFGVTLFGYIKANKYDQITNLVPTAKEFKLLIDSSSLEGNIREEKLSSAVTDADKNLEWLDKTFTAFKKQTGIMGIDWTLTHLKDISYIHKKAYKIETADLVLSFSYKAIIYKIEVKNCMKVQKAWYMGDQIIFADTKVKQ